MKITKKQIQARFNKSVLEKLMEEVLKETYDGKPRYTERGIITKEQVIELLNSAKAKIVEKVGCTGKKYSAVYFPYIYRSCKDGKIKVEHGSQMEFSFNENGEVSDYHIKKEFLEKGAKFYVDCKLRRHLVPHSFVKDSTAIPIYF